MMLSRCGRGPASMLKVVNRFSFGSRALASRKPLCASTSRLDPNSATPSSRLVHSSQGSYQQAAVREKNQDGEAENTQITKFEELIERDLVHSNLVRSITEGMGHHTMTPVQSLTINQALQGNDIIAQAKTGTGKTIGFLLPLIQNILTKNTELARRQRYSKARPSDIRAIIVSPTRELAEQIAVEASKLCSHTDLIVQVAVGGNSKSQMLRKTQREGCHILVATPGRLNDLLTDPYSRISAPNLTTLVLDEADRMLDAGFSKDIEDIVALLPDRAEVDRQTLLFSATIPREVMGLVRRILKPGFDFVQTVQEGEVATHDKVPQSIVITPGMENYMPTLVEFAKREIENASNTSNKEARPFKAMVYLNSTNNVILSGEIFQNLRGESKGLFGQHPLHPAEILVMHGQLTQERRTRTSERFRRAKSAILFSTDVTARGMDFPNVTHVIQIGLPPNREQYIHRIGRTGRGDKTGAGYIFVHRDELVEARRILRGLPITPDDSLEAAIVDMTNEAQLPAKLAQTLVQVSDATQMIDRETKTKAYMAALAQATSNPAAIVPALNQWTKYAWGWPKPPSVAQGLARKLGLSRIPGLNIGGSEESRDGFEDRGLGRGSGRGFDRGFGGGERRSGSRGGRGFGGDRGDRGDRRGGSGRGRSGFGDRNDRGYGSRGRNSGSNSRGSESSF